MQSEVKDDCEPNEGVINEISRLELKSVIARMKKSRALGSVGITIDAWVAMD